MNEIKWIASQRGNSIPVINGHIFKKNRSIGEKVFWRCEERGCKTNAVTKSGQLTSLTGGHNHSTNTMKVVKREFKAKAKLMAANDPFTTAQNIYNEACSRIINEAEESMRAEVAAVLPAFSSTKTTISRKKKENFPTLLPFIKDAQNAESLQSTLYHMVEEKYQTNSNRNLDRRTKDVMSNYEEQLKLVANRIASYPDFPKKGIIFRFRLLLVYPPNLNPQIQNYRDGFLDHFSRDVFPVLRDVQVFPVLITLLENSIKESCSDFNIIVGLDSRGFLFGPILALNFGVPFVPIRKVGKLPGSTVKVTYDLEYGTDSFEAQADSIKKDSKVIIIDDLLATGGSLAASCKLMESMGASVLLCLVVIELLDLKGATKVAAPLKSLVQYTSVSQTLCGGTLVCHQDDATSESDNLTSK